MTLLEEMARAMVDRDGEEGTNHHASCEELARVAAQVVAGRLERCMTWGDVMKLIEELRGL
jgi:hypothetical protein